MFALVLPKLRHLLIIVLHLRKLLEVWLCHVLESLRLLLQLLAIARVQFVKLLVVVLTVVERCESTYLGVQEQLPEVVQLERFRETLVVLHLQLFDEIV